MPSCFLTVCAVVVPSFVLSPSVLAAKIYYTDQPDGNPGTVRSVGLDGSDPDLVITYPGAPSLRGIGWHRASGRIFVLDNTAKVIRSILPNGTGEQPVTSISGSHVGSDLEVDDTEGKIYWAETSSSSALSGFVKSCNLDGTNVQTAVTTPGGIDVSPYFLFLDRPGGFIYWGVQENASSGSGPTTFRRATFDGTIDVAFGITTETRTRDIGIDPNTGIAYWADRQRGAIYRRPVAGGANQTVIDNMNAPHGVALDVFAQKVYWADTGQRGSGAGLSARRVARCNFDGSEYESLSVNSGANQPWDLALDLSSATYAEWCSRFFPAAAGQRLALDDADGDGVPNLLEYAFENNPRRRGASAGVVPNGNGIKFPRRRTSPLTYQVEVSTDLSAWRFNGDASGATWTIEMAVETLSPDVESVTVGPAPALAGATRLFYRVRISTAEP